MNTGSLRRALPFIAAALVTCTYDVARAQGATPKPAVPLDPVAGIVAAFKTHKVVALGEGDHTNEQGHAVRLALIRDPRFAKVANDIVVEFGNSRYQDVMDRYVGGEAVPQATLRQVWQNTTQASALWDVPIYEETFRAVREANAKLPKKRALRVLLGDAPIDWDQVSTVEDIRKAGRSDAIPAGIIEREVIAKGRRALVIYGDQHYVRRNLYWNMADKAAAEQRFTKPVDTIVTRLESAGTKVFSITTSFVDLSPLQPDIANWTAPKLAILAGTPLGLASYRFLYPHDIYIRRADNTWEQVSSDPARSPLMQDQFDAILYIGPQSSITYSKLTASQCADQAYMQMRLARMRITNAPNPEAQTAELKEFCAKLLE